MLCINSFVDDLLFPVLTLETEIKERVEKSNSEVKLVVEHRNDRKTVKIIDIDGIKEKIILKFIENSSLLNVCCSFLIYPFKAFQMNKNGEFMIILRDYYVRDLEDIIHNEFMSSSDICSIICNICDILMIFSEYCMVIGNIKSNNIVYEENNNVKLCDLWLNTLRRKEEDVRLYDMCFISQEELNELECDEKSVIWSVGCILYEMINKKLPFYEDETKENIMKCKYSIDAECIEMKEMVDRMLKTKNEDRVSLKELRKEMKIMSEIFKDDDRFLMILEERKEVLFNNDYAIVRIPIIFPYDYYLKSNIYEEIRDRLIESYNKYPNKKILSVLFMIKKCNEDKSITDKLKYQIHHHCEYKKKYYLDEMVFNIYIDKYHQDKIVIDSYCSCFCEQGIDFLFRVLKVLNPINLQFNKRIPIKHQSLFGSCFSQLTNLRELDISKCNLTINFIASFIKSILCMKLEYVNLQNNPIGPKGFKLLFPYLYLLINKDYTLDLYKMNLNDESMISLSEELFKYPNVQKIDIRGNKNIHSKGLKSLFSKILSVVFYFDFNKNKDLLIDNDIPELFKPNVCYSYNLNINSCEIDDDFLKSFISLRLNELKEISRLDLSNNKLTHKSIELLIKNLSSFSHAHLQLYGNAIGDEGMKILSPYIKYLQWFDELNHYMFVGNEIIFYNCSKMGLSSIGLKYLLDGLNNIRNRTQIDISDNKIDSDGMVMLINYIKDNTNIEKLLIYNNPIGNDGFKLILNNLNKLIQYDDINLSNISVDDEIAILLANNLALIKKCNIINLNDNNIRMNGLKSICSKSLEKEEYPFIQIKCSFWTNEELEYYLNYCVRKDNKYHNRKYDLSNMNINDSYISLIKQIDYNILDLSNNHISYKGLKEIINSLPEDVDNISIYNNQIGDEGIEIICKYIEKYLDYYNSLSLNLSSIGMSEKGLKMLIERLKDCKLLTKMNILGNELNENELRLMKENKEVFEELDELSITLKENVKHSELESFLETFQYIEVIKVDGLSEEEKKEIVKEHANVK